MSIAEFTSTSPPETGLGAFWRNIRGARKRVEPATPRNWLQRDRAPQASLFADRVAPEPRPRLRITAERLMDSYFSSLAAGEHVYRELKTAFDGLCEEAEINGITDKRFATWLQDRGAVRRRINARQTTVYRIGMPPRKKRKNTASKGAKRRGARGIREPSR